MIGRRFVEAVIGVMLGLLLGACIARMTPEEREWCEEHVKWQCERCGY